MHEESRTRLTSRSRSRIGRHPARSTGCGPDSTQFPCRNACQTDHDGIGVKTLGDFLQLGGTLITAVGLFYAWNKATGRISAAQQALVDAWSKAQAAWNRLSGRSGDVTVQVPTATAFAAAGRLKVRAVAAHVVDPTQSTYRQIEGLAAETRAIREAITDLHEHIAKVENAPRLDESDVQASITEALGRFDSDLKVSTGQDFVIAIGGVAVTVVGMLFGLASALI